MFYISAARSKWLQRARDRPGIHDQFQQIKAVLTDMNVDIDLAGISGNSHVGIIPMP